MIGSRRHRQEQASTRPEDVRDIQALLLGRFAAHGDTRFNVSDLLQAEIKDRTEFPYLMAAYYAASSVLLFGSAGFRTEYKDRSKLVGSETQRRDLILAAVREKIQRDAGGRVGRPVWAADAAAAFYTLSGEKCWSPEEEGLMAEDSLRVMNAHLESDYITLDKKHRLDSAAFPAADYKIITGEQAWDDELNTDMANAALDSAQSFWEREPDLYGVATIPTVRRIGVARVLMAETILPVHGDPNRGVDLAF